MTPETDTAPDDLPLHKRYPSKERQKWLQDRRAQLPPFLHALGKRGWNTDEERLWNVYAPQEREQVELILAYQAEINRLSREVYQSLVARWRRLARASSGEDNCRLEALVTELASQKVLQRVPLW